MSLVERAADLAETVSDLPNEERLEYLIELGQKYKTSIEFIEAERVRGCQSQVWMRVWEDGGVRVAAKSDAFIVQGLLAILVQIVGGATKQECSDFDYPQWLQQVGLGLTMSRMQGMAAVQNVLHKFARA